MADSPTQTSHTARIMAGIPAQNNALYWRLRFSVGDPVAVIELPADQAKRESILILRDIEMSRARQHARIDRIACPKDYAPIDGLSGDRETATAQAAAECLHRAGVTRVIADRTLPLIFAELLRQAGIDVACDITMNVESRRRKDPTEIAHLRESQRVTEDVMQRACRMIGLASARRDGVLLHDNSPLTSERVRAAIQHWLLDLDYTPTSPIVAGGRSGADCHNDGQGELMTGQPVIVDIFPRSSQSHYCGDCTRTVVHGDIPDQVLRMHAAVREAKRAAIAAIRAGVVGEAVHASTTQAILQRGYSIGLPPEGAPDSYCALTHGTGHGIGLDVHEPPLLDVNGPELLEGDVVTVEPGLYRADIGGIRIEDMVVVTKDGSENLNRLDEGLCWR